MARSLAADLIFIDGRIHALDANERVHRALAARDGRIVALGDSAEIRELAGPATEVVDLAGRTAIPGIVDSHCHPDAHAVMLLKQHDLGWPGMRSLDDVLAAIDRATREAPRDRWFFGYRYDDVKLGAVPTMADLDSAGNGRPVFVLRTDGHVGYANARACALVGFDRDTPDPPFGRIDRDPATGALTGLMREAAAHRFRAVAAGETTVADYVEGLPPLFARYLAHGVTSVHNSLTASKAIRAYQMLKAEGRLGVRVGIIASGFEDGLIDAFVAAGIRSGFGDERLRVVGVEWCPDCSTSGRTAAYYEPYVGTPIPGEPEPNRGMLLHDPDDLKEWATRAHAAGLRVCMDGVGDRGIDVVLDAFEAALAAHPAADHRMRIEHCCYVTPAVRARIKRLGVVDSSATAFMHDLGDAYIRNRGAAAMRHMWPHRTLIDEGIPAPGHSDAPVCDLDPWRAIWSMVTRRTDSGQPIGPEEAVTVTEALGAYTRLGAFAGGEDHLKGTLEVGKLADVAVLDRDVFAGPPDALRDTRTDLTVVGGAVAYRRGA